MLSNDDPVERENPNFPTILLHSNYNAADFRSIFGAKTQWMFNSYRFLNSFTLPLIVEWTTKQVSRHSLFDSSLHLLWDSQPLMRILIGDGTEMADLMLSNRQSNTLNDYFEL